LDRLPLVLRLPSLPDMSPETYVEVEISQVDLLDLTCNAKFLRKLET
jgi:exoribonuclease-2